MAFPEGGHSIFPPTYISSSLWMHIPRGKPGAKQIQQMLDHKDDDRLESKSVFPGTQQFDIELKSIPTQHIFNFMKNSWHV